MGNLFIEFTYQDDDGNEIESKLPARFEMCNRCEGHGTILNPSIGNHAYTSEEFYESFPDEEDREQYFKRGGIYDIACPKCNGEKVVKVVDEKACAHNDEYKSLLKIYNTIQQDMLEYERECRAERIMEARMMGDHDYYE